MCDRLAPLVSLLAAPTHAFEMAWNMQYPERCANPPPPDDIITRFGVRANANNSFNGQVVSTLYNHPGPSSNPTEDYTIGYWPSYYPERCTTACTAVNGGIPQLANLTLHLERVAEDVKRLFPDPDFSGMVVIDQEMWQPDLKFWGDPAPAARWNAYQNASFALAGGDKDAAVAAWNASALHLMVRTLEVAQSVRPRGRFGYYGVLNCPDAQLDVGGGVCNPQVRARNDALAPLWRASSTWFPSIYSSCPFNASRVPPTCDPSDREPERIRATLNEALRSIA